MSKSNLNYIVDLFMIIAFLVVAVTGLMKWPGLLKFIGINTKNVSWFLLRKIHDWSGVIMIFLVFVHFVLHWKFIVVSTKNLFKK